VHLCASLQESFLWLTACKLGPLDVGLLSFEDIYGVMAVNEVKIFCNAKFQKTQNSTHLAMEKGKF
jgi:hypothetical protein